MPTPKIVKASGLIEEFSSDKLYHSLELSKVPDHLIPEIVKFVNSRLKEGSTTKDVHEFARDFLLEHDLITNALDYDLRRAVMRLGPSGYPFESFVSKILDSTGYKTEVGSIVAGQCITHEIDIIGHKDNRHYLIECKYHNQPGTKTDVQVALYTYARFLDVTNALKKHKDHSTENYHVALITNTKVSKDAIDYARCQQMLLISWTYPKGNNLKDLILQSGLHPVTSLTSLSYNQLESLLKQNIVTCADLKDALEKTGLPDLFDEIQKKSFLSQIAQICH